MSRTIWNGFVQPVSSHSWVDLALSEDRFGDPFACQVRRLVLPDSNGMPSNSPKAFIGVSVSRRIRPKLLSPPMAVHFRDRPVIRTSVPKAAVDKYCNVLNGKCKICSSAHLR